MYIPEQGKAQATTPLEHGQAQCPRDRDGARTHTRKRPADGSHRVLFVVAQQGQPAAARLDCTDCDACCGVYITTTTTITPCVGSGQRTRVKSHRPLYCRVRALTASRGSFVGRDKGGEPREGAIPPPVDEQGNGKELQARLELERLNCATQTSREGCCGRREARQ